MKPVTSYIEYNRVGRVLPRQFQPKVDTKTRGEYSRLSRGRGRPLWSVGSGLLTSP